MSRRFPAPVRRSPIGVRHLLVLVVLVLLTASGTAFTATLEGVPQTSLESSTTEFTASALYFDDTSGSTVAHVTITSSRPAYPAQQVRAQVRSVAQPSNPFQQCSPTNAGRTTWSCPVPGMTAAQATAGTFAFLASL